MASIGRIELGLARLVPGLVIGLGYLALRPHTSQVL